MEDNDNNVTVDITNTHYKKETHITKNKWLVEKSRKDMKTEDV